MNTVWVVAAVMLVLAAGITMFRLLAGPSTLDRLVGLDTLIAVTMCGVGTWAAYSLDTTVTYSLVALAHDLTQWGYSGRVQAAANVGGVVTLQLDDKVPYNPGAGARKIGLRIPGETGYRLFDVTAFAGDSNVVTLMGAWPGGVALPGDSASNPPHDTLWIYDFAATPGKRLRITEIEPAPDLKGARVTAVPEPDEFWSYMASGVYTVPALPAAGPALAASNIRVTQG